MDLRTEPREQIAQWVLEGFGGCFLPGYKVIAVFDGDRLMGAAVFDAFTARDCNFHVRIADRRCVSRRTLRAVFDYPFRQLKLDRVSAQVMADNAASLEAVQRLGFVYEGAKRQRTWASQLQFGMLMSECPWVTDPVEHEYAEMLKGAA
jgi:RimJ/RimL family protein N-acetyltransferase